MNTQAQFLKLRLVNLESKLAQLLLDNRVLFADIELTESIGCAFVWDVSWYGLEAACKNFEAALNPPPEAADAAS